MHILIVVFNQWYRMVLEHVLKQAGFDVRAVQNPRQAAHLLDECIDLLITDFHFPDEVGNPDFNAAAELCRAARDSIRADLPIVVLTNLPSNDVGMEAILKDNAFPANLRFFDVVLEAPDDIVKFVKGYQPVLPQALMPRG
jgi:CheY-like chemotaxis protein